MNKTLLIGLLAGVVVIGGAIIFMQKGNSSNADGDAGAGTSENLSGTLNQLIASGKDITCTFLQEESGAVAEGTVYIAAKGEKIRGDFTMTQQGQTMTGSTIRRDGSNYSWGETPFGSFATKVAVDDTSSDKESFDLEDEDINYTCSPWRVDNSVFNLPSGVNFDDINAEVQQIDAAMEQVNDLKCSACDQVPDAAAQAQCRAALGC